MGTPPSSSRRDFFHNAGAGLACAACWGLTGCRRAAPQRTDPPREAAPEPDATATPASETAPSNGRATFEPAYLALERSGELAGREEQLWSMLERCELCMRRCEQDRLGGDAGVCGEAGVKVASMQLHFGEERPLRGRGGSGTIFFSHCNLLCCFCLNWQIAHRGDGEPVDHPTLARMMVRLQERGAHNINLVTPTHVLPHVVKALRLAIADGLRLPIVYNTSSYERPAVMRLLDGIVDIYLPDFKYQDGERAARYSARAGDYPEVAAANIAEMHRQVGELQVDDSGVAQRGLLIRHLVMPDNAAGTDRFVQWVARELTPSTAVNIMGQYRPYYRAFDHAEIARPVNDAEMRQAMRWARAAGLTRLVTG